MAVSRFVIDGGSKTLPLWIPEMLNTTPNINTTIYSMSISYIADGFSGLNDGCITQAYMLWQPENPYIGVPNTSVNTLTGDAFQKDLTNPYYEMHNFQTFINMFNTTVQTIYTNLLAQVSVAISSGITQINTDLPTLEYNPADKTFSIVFDTFGFGLRTSTTERLRFFMSDSLVQLMSSFNVKKVNFTDTTGVVFKMNEIIPFQTFGDDNVFLKKSLITCGSVPPSIPTAKRVYITHKQQYSTLDSVWSPVSSLIFSTTMSINPELVSELQNLSLNNGVKMSGGAQNTITDISLDLESPADYKGRLTYSPEVLRWISMGSGVLSNINVKVFWKSKITGALKQLHMVGTSNVNLKLVFKKIAE